MTIIKCKGLGQGYNKTYSTTTADESHKVSTNMQIKYIFFTNIIHLYDKNFIKKNLKPYPHPMVNRCHKLYLQIYFSSQSVY